MEIISVTKEPKWSIYLGALLTLVGLIGFIPFKFEGWFFIAGLLHISVVIGALLVLRGFQKIGWRISLEGNVLYYQKFNLYSSWKKRRSAEFSLSLEKINSLERKGNKLRITYEPGRELLFNTKGMTSLAQQRLDRLIGVVSK